MKDRQAQLLKMIVEQYAATGLPIGSKSLVENTDLDVSGATIRNEMRALEEEGFLTHPHTSAGRIPTESGYRFYVEHLLAPTKPSKKMVHDLITLTKDIGDEKQRAKQAAKYASEFVGNAAIVSFGGNSLYYTGISNLFAQPEFRDYAHMVEVSTILDQCEERIDALYDLVSKDGTTILIGEENPLGRACSVVVKRFSKNNLFAVLGPMRMDYARTVGLVDYLETHI